MFLLPSFALRNTLLCGANYTKVKAKLNPDQLVHPIFLLLVIGSWVYMWSARLEFSQDLVIDALFHWGCETSGRRVGYSNWEPLGPYGKVLTENQTQLKQQRWNTAWKESDR